MLTGQEHDPYDFTGGLKSKCFKVLESNGFEIVPKEGASLESELPDEVNPSSRKDWSEDELRGAVNAYIKMRELEVRGESFTKKDIYNSLAREFGRSVKAFEYRMQNISHVYSLQGRRWISGLRPAKNVGPRNLRIIEQLISDAEGQQFPESVVFEAEVQSKLDTPDMDEPLGFESPERTTQEVTSFKRDPKVVAWVLREAKGHCECCDNPSPFTKEDGTPYLEVHHVQRLCDGGPDTTSNAAALCPNCHREMHYGKRKQELATKLTSKIARLK